MRNVSGESATYLLLGQRLHKDIVDYPKIGKRLVIDGESEMLCNLPSVKATDIDANRHISGPGNEE
ncbi:MAG: hypothetical protein AAGG55_05550 [Pseudomonadota bacterium]